MASVANIIGLLVQPSGIAFALFIAGLVARIWPPAKSASWWLLAAGGSVAMAFSTGIAAALLMSPIEYEYPAMKDGERPPQITDIVVLTGWASDDPNMPLSGRINDSSAYRLLMTLELYNDCDACRIIVSGDENTARIMAEVLREVGVSSQRIVIEGRSANTAASAANIRPIVGSGAFLLVTSAGHLPRSMRAMHAAGLDPIPVATDHKMPKEWWRAEFTPSPTSLVVSDLAVHEYLGRLWYWLTGRT